MKYFILSLLGLLLSLSLFSQDKVYMKDGKLLGERSVLVSSCVSGMSEKTGSKEDTSINKEALCDCVISILASHFTFKEFMKMISKDNFNFEKLMYDKRYGNLGSEIITCVFSNMAQVKKTDTLQSGIQKEFIDACTGAVKDEVALKDYDAQTYCICVYNQFVTKGFDKELLQAFKKDINAPAVQELIVPCLQEAKKEVAGVDSVSISGGIEKEEIPLLALGNIHRVKLKFGTVEKYFTLDSGASDVLISKTLEKQLLEAGFMKKQDYVGEEIYRLADGTKVKGKNYLVSNVQIGSFKVDKVMLGVLDSDKADLLCGKSLLDKFSVWKVDNITSKLILQK